MFRKIFVTKMLPLQSIRWVNLNFYGSILLLTSDFNLLFSLSINSNFLFNEANSFSNKNDLF